MKASMRRPGCAGVVLTMAASGCGWWCITNWSHRRRNRVGTPQRRHHVNTTDNDESAAAAAAVIGVDKMSSQLESDVCPRLQVALSGESYEGKRRPGRKQWQTTARYMA